MPNCMWLEGKLVEYVVWTKSIRHNYTLSYFKNIFHRIRTSITYDIEYENVCLKEGSRWAYLEWITNGVKLVSSIAWDLLEAVGGFGFRISIICTMSLACIIYLPLLTRTHFSLLCTLYTPFSFTLHTIAQIFLSWYRACTLPHFSFPTQFSFPLHTTAHQFPSMCILPHTNPLPCAHYHIRFYFSLYITAH